MTGKITFSRITKSFPGSFSGAFSETKLLSDVDIALHGGKVTLLTGQNGTGKTTLLRILAGLLKPDFGIINFGATDEHWKQARKRLLKNVMYLHQRPYMFEGSVSRNMALAVPGSMTRKQTRERVNQALEWGMLTRHALANAKTLSGGQQQRVALARAWLRQSPIMLLDEPIANMDTQSSARTIKLLHQLKGANTAILICSHNHQIFDSLVDRHVELANYQLTETQSIKADNPYRGNITHINREKFKDNAAR
ncbi:ABC transporter ATP-binding protein [Candidatus Spongiihabitans sp.]|uniref:ABC transporter ATP-binding protein n=1 Tax=Candidatus Spongiihabitans sp. TaxID=3101308 RepID=UPI003C7029A8